MSSSPGSGSPIRPTTPRHRSTCTARSQCRGGRPTDGQDHLQRPAARLVRAVRRHIPARSIRSTCSRPAPTPTNAFIPEPDRHRPVQGRFLHGERPGHLRRQTTNYREPNKPFFAEGQPQGRRRRRIGRAGRAADRRLGLRLEPAGRAADPQAAREQRQGHVIGPRHRMSSALLINFSDPNKEVNGQKSQKDTPHPFFSDQACARRLALATDRETIANQFYLGGDREPPAPEHPERYPRAREPEHHLRVQSRQGASRLLDEAGWTLDGDTRKKDGVEMKVVYSTSINCGPPKDAGPQQAELGADRHQGQPQAGRRRYLLRQRGRQRAERPALLC